MSEGQGTPAPADVVAAFNLSGYQATFAAVAQQLRVHPAALYAEYPSPEVLGEIWLSEALPKANLTNGIGAVFAECTFRLLSMMQEQRDFSRAWLAALRGSGVRLQKLERLHTGLQNHYAGWLTSRADAISLPAPLVPEDVLGVVADALSLATLNLIAAWDVDRSSSYGETGKRVESTGYLLDALLTARPEFGDKGLLVHLVALLGLSYDEVLSPLLYLLREPQHATVLTRLLAAPGSKPVRSLRDLMPDTDRATRLVNIVVHALRTAGEKHL